MNKYPMMKNQIFCQLVAKWKTLTLEVSYLALVGRHEATIGTTRKRRQKRKHAFNIFLFLGSKSVQNKIREYVRRRRKKTSLILRKFVRFFDWPLPPCHIMSYCLPQFLPWLQNLNLVLQICHCCCFSYFQLFTSWPSDSLTVFSCYQVNGYGYWAH